MRTESPPDAFRLSRRVSRAHGRWDTQRAAVLEGDGLFILECTTEAPWDPEAPQDPPEPLARKVSKATPERLENLAHLDQWDPAGHLDLLENLEMTVKLESLEKVVNVDLLALRELVDSQELPVFLESRDTE
ncbi:hypothetical protein ANANG_G00255950 [Anguilla anguilla]|uniref:Uncharacterized protein n=1 Tax=Anguilla anguilla TaxID=7936 RepID=A0A9D3LUG3_ANGAN|nr:hypothetical protein ANANG_G00255950 [Anguilla anguilla]